MHAKILMTLSIVCVSAIGQTTSPDWKYYGAASLRNGETQATFYDSQGVIRRPNGHIEVWTKGVRQRDVQRIEKEDKKYLNRVGDKLSAGYRPPYATVVKVDEDLQITLAVLEDIANNAQVSPSMRMLIEIDCTGRMDRWLSRYFSVGGSS